MIISTEETGPEQWCVVYNAKTNALVQIHHHIGTAGDKPLAPDDLAKAALSCGVEYSTESLAVAHPDKGVELTDDVWPEVVNGEMRLVKVERPGRGVKG